jgi:hypothetical protein
MSNLVRLFLGALLAAIAILAIAVGLARHNTELLAPFHLLIFFVLIALYVAPALVALYRTCTATGWIVSLNILLGWTILGWAIAMAWAVRGKTAAAGPSLPLSSPRGTATRSH